ncbi:hypothetical protein [Actinoallomurus sp. NPDC050550]|uniref:hypothetical protein n=1 Tax=Actinoallomurus sp. NPDC050550 TaxID=3154937 RepID=UPI0034085BAE
MRNRRTRPSIVGWATVRATAVTAAIAMTFGLAPPAAEAAAAAAHPAGPRGHPRTHRIHGYDLQVDGDKADVSCDARARAEGERL